jgi:tRNA (cmo5U34)-methyltransferase
MATLLTLLPFDPGDAVKVVELGSGEGYLSEAVLNLWPGSSILALDGSPSMLERSAQRLNPYSSRARTGFFDLESDDWRPELDGADAVLSSLCLHHLDGPGKQKLFRDVGDRLTPGGAFLIADIVAPRGSPAERLFADTWDDSARRLSEDVMGSDALFDLFLETQWNHYRFPDEMDKPSPLFDQLKWLEAAGFSAVDCFWMQAGHAIYGGYAGARERAHSGVDYTAALAAARSALQI